MFSLSKTAISMTKKNAAKEVVHFKPILGMGVRHVPIMESVALHLVRTICNIIGTPILPKRSESVRFSHIPFVSFGSNSSQSCV